MGERGVAASDAEHGASSRRGVHAGDGRGGHGRMTGVRVGDARAELDPLGGLGGQREGDVAVPGQVLAVDDEPPVEAVGLGPLRHPDRHPRKRDPRGPDLRHGRRVTRPACARSRSRAAWAAMLTMSLELVALCVDASDPLRLARFWAEALHWEVGDETIDRVSLVPTDGTRFRMDFLATPTPKLGPNRHHLDLTTTSLDDQPPHLRHVLDDQRFGGPARRARRAPHRHRPEARGGPHRPGRPRGQRALPDRADQQLPRRLPAHGCDQLRRVDAGRVLLERRSRLAVGVGSGRGDRDPSARRHRAQDHLGWTASGPEARQEPIPLRGQPTRRRRPARRGRPSRGPRRHVDRHRPQAMSRVSSCSTPTATSSASCVPHSWPSASDDPSQRRSGPSPATEPTSAMGFHLRAGVRAR